MGDITIFFASINCLITSLLLWLITFLGSYLYEPKQDLNREVHFECGFFSINKSIPAFNINFIVSAIFLVLYDIELILLIPTIFNFYFLNTVNFCTTVILIISIIFSLLIDVESNTVKWYFN